MIDGNRDSEINDGTLSKMDKLDVTASVELNDGQAKRKKTKKRSVPINIGSPHDHDIDIYTDLL